MRTGYLRAEQVVTGAAKSLQRPDSWKRETGQSTGQVERGRGKTSLPGREKELEERARARRWGDCRQGGAGQRGGDREQQGEGDSQTVENEGRELGSSGKPRETLHRDPQREQVQSEEERRRSRMSEEGDTAGKSRGTVSSKQTSRGKESHRVSGRPSLTEYHSQTLRGSERWTKSLEAEYRQSQQKQRAKGMMKRDGK